MQHYRELLSEILETAVSAKPCSFLTLTALLLPRFFWGQFQGLVIQSMISGTTQHLMDQARAVFGLYQNGLEAKP